LLPFFPTLYPDEILFSALGRYHAWSYTPQFRRTLSEILGEDGGCASVSLPSHIGRLIKVLPSGTTLTGEDIIQKSTLFPLFRPFLPADRADTIRGYMIGNQGSVIYQTVGAMASGIPMLRYLRYCRRCIQEDVERIGEAYWHRVHQVPGVMVCPKHLCMLSDSEVSISPLSNKTLFHPVSADEVRLGDSDTGTYGFPRADVSLAVQWFLDGDPPVLGLQNLRQQYIHLLQRKDLATFRGRIRQKELAEAFSRFYSADFLDETFSPVGCDQAESWLSRLLQKQRKACHPIRHILLILFLGTTPEGFFSRSYEQSNPFGEAPWPCLNPICEDYRKNLIQTCQISRDSKTGYPVGTFICNCGFSYARNGPDNNADSRYKIGRIKAFGGKWLQKLWEFYIVEKCSLREVARRLMVDPGTVKNQLAIIFGEKAKRTAALKESCDERRDEYRTKLLLAVRLNPDRCRTEIRNAIPGAYTWLYRHDWIWLSAHLPPVIHGGGPAEPKIDWDKRDREICYEVLSAAKEIKKKEPLIRVSVSSLGKCTGHLSLLHKHLDKLPRTREVLNLVLENIEEYQERRITYVVEEMKRNKIKPVIWKIMRAAGLKKGDEHKVIRIVLRECSEVKQLENLEGKLYN
jgi:hypothetical protein